MARFIPATKQYLKIVLFANRNPLGYISGHKIVKNTHLLPFLLKYLKTIMFSKISVPEFLLQFYTYQFIERLTLYNLRGVLEKVPKPFLKHVVKTDFSTFFTE
jgi:hypothetical protein